MKPLLIALAIAHAADAVTTLTAMQAGAREGNPLLPSQPVALVAVIGAETVLQIVILERLSRSHPTLARNLGLVAFGVESSAVGFNIRVTLDARAGR
jgi:hypothetical protein